MYIKEYPDWNMHAEFMFNSELNKYYATKVEAYSKIKQTEDSWGVEISKKVGKDEVITAINADTSGVKIKGNNISLESSGTVNKSLEITEDGNVHMCDDTVIVNPSGISMKSGTRIIGASGLLSTFIFYTGFDEIGKSNLGGSVQSKFVFLDVEIPDDFAITNAKIYVDIVCRRLVGYSSTFGITDGYYAPKQLKLYYNTDSSFGMTYNYPYESELSITVDAGNIVNDFGEWTPYGSSTIQEKTLDITKLLTSNRYVFKLESNKAYSANDEYTNGGLAKIQLVVTGYMK